MTKNIIFFFLALDVIVCVRVRVYFDVLYIIRNLSLHLPAGRMTMKNSNRFDSIWMKKHPRLQFIVKIWSFSLLLFGNCCLLFSLRRHHRRCPRCRCILVFFTNPETNNNVQSVSVSAPEHLVIFFPFFHLPSNLSNGEGSIKHAYINIPTKSNEIAPNE